MNPAEQRWEELGRRDRPSWYLDPLVASQKKEVNSDLIRRWLKGCPIGSVLKTDLFEEAHGEDQILFDLFGPETRTIGIDIAHATARQAARRCTRSHTVFCNTDVRCLPLPDNCCDAIISNSTLDHFESAADYRQAVRELARILRPGGVLVITLDNVRNPLYRLLRWTSRRGWAPFVLGYTTSADGLRESLESAGLQVTDSGLLIHNPRLVSTVVFLVLRRLLGCRADGPIRLLLRLFAALDMLPTRRWTACFVAARGVKSSRH